MTSFVYDFKDIASRMKGELAPSKTMEEIIQEVVDMDGIPNPSAPRSGIFGAKRGRVTPVAPLCHKCDDNGWVEDPYTSRPPAFRECNLCGNPFGKDSP